MRNGFIGYFDASGAAKIRYGVWKTRAQKRSGAVVVLNGRTEFLEKYGETIRELVSRGLTVFSLDWRGQGLSARMLPNSHKGHVASFSDYLKDLDRFMTRIVAPHCPGDIHMMGHSMGGHLALRYLHDRPGRIKKAVLVCPMLGLFDPKPVAMAVGMLAKTAQKLGYGPCYAPGCGDWKEKDQKFRGNRLTSDEKRFFSFVELIRQNPDLALGGVTYDWLAAALASIDLSFSPAYPESISTPVLMVCGGRDKVVSARAQKAMAARLPNCFHKVVQGAMHELLMESDPFRQKFWALFDRFFP